MDTHIPARTRRNRQREGSAGSRHDADMLARILVWGALGWTVAMLIVTIFFAKFGHGEEKTVFDQLGVWAIVLALIPIAIVSLPLISAIADRVNRITPIVAVVTAFLVVGSIVFAGGFFIPSAFALMAAALLEVGERR